MGVGAALAREKAECVATIFPQKRVRESYYPGALARRRTNSAHQQVSTPTASDHDDVIAAAFEFNAVEPVVARVRRENPRACAAHQTVLGVAFEGVYAAEFLRGAPARMIPSRRCTAAWAARHEPKTGDGMVSRPHQRGAQECGQKGSSVSSVARGSAPVTINASAPRGWNVGIILMRLMELALHPFASGHQEGDR